MKRLDPLGPLILGVGIGYAVGLDQNWMYAGIAFFLGSVIIFVVSFVTTFRSEWGKRAQDN